MAAYPYCQLVGSLMYLAIATQPDIAHAVQHLSQFLANPGLAHWKAAIHVVKYLKGTRELRLVLRGKRPLVLTGLTDSNWANCPDTCRSVSGYVFLLGTGAISWNSRKQPTVATSSCEAEYIAACNATKEAVWLRYLLAALDLAQPLATAIGCDNQGTNAITKDPSFHAKIKHIEIQWHYTRKKVQDGTVKFHYVRTTNNTANIFTKALPAPTFIRLRHYLGLCQPRNSPQA
jgi:hypothetical protein